MISPPSITVAELVERYEGLLIDAYGVLVHHDGAFGGAAEFIDTLDRGEMPYAIITNDASRLPESCAQKYRADGIAVDARRVVTSGALTTDYFARRDLVGAACLALGPPDTARYAERAGGRVVDTPADDFEVLLVGNAAGYDFVETVDTALTTLFHRVDAGDPVELVVPNPDLIYQRSQHSFGFTSGSIACLFENALQTRYPGADHSFARLGKPYAPMFQRGVELVGTRDCAVLGDQLATDIKGANDFGLDSVLVATGLTDVDHALANSPVQPDFVLDSLRV